MKKESAANKVLFLACSLMKAGISYSLKTSYWNNIKIYVVEVVEKDNSVTIFKYRVDNGEQIY